MRKLRALCAPALALCLVNCSDTPPPVSKPAIEKSVRDVEANMVKTFAAKDAAAFAANYTSDAVMMTPGQPPMSPKEDKTSEDPGVGRDADSSAAATTQSHHRSWLSTPRPMSPSCT